ncbi:polysaccharide biosynthesis/export family protein [uncultured Sphingomonas sp.]|uniref:polysaccharide biosynthesis/export family protein n=1 Tax=uncultured Sphingomonas sp. TaxID=158754 RepID=UPI0035CBFDFB
MSIGSRSAPPLLLAAASACLLGACASLPSSGPTANQIVRGARADATAARIVDLDAQAMVDAVAVEAAADARNPTLASLAVDGRGGLIGVGDVLEIRVYEVGVSLFGGARMTGELFDPSARAEIFPAVVVDAGGTIKLPFTEQLQVAGRTPREVQSLVERAYRGKSQLPQVLVAVRENLSETVFVSGDVRRSGRIALTLQQERLLDAVATAGGTVSRTQDMVVRFTRAGRTVEERLDRIFAGAPDDLVLVAGDRIQLIQQPQSYVVLGASNRVSQVGFDQSDVTLAEAIARAGGPNDNTADPRSVFLFRYAASEAGATPVPGAAADTPTIYRVDLLRPASYFLAQRFPMRNRDVLYVSNAPINRTAKAVGILNQLFSPFVTARAISGQ